MIRTTPAKESNAPVRVRRLNDVLRENSVCVCVHAHAPATGHKQSVRLSGEPPARPAVAAEAACNKTHATHNFNINTCCLSHSPTSKSISNCSCRLHTYTSQINDPKWIFRFSKNRSIICITLQSIFFIHCLSSLKPKISLGEIVW